MRHRSRAIEDSHPFTSSRKRHHGPTCQATDQNDVLGPGRYLAGGMWVRGLCDKCNHMSGVKVDRAWVSLTNDDIAPILVGDVQPW
jgi:hypothetical protein